MTDVADGFPSTGEQSGRRPAALGERAALAGYVPQYEVAAGLLLQVLTDESVEWLALLDPEAGRLDDFQLATPDRLDAYQIKWSQSGEQLPWGELRRYVVELVADRRKLAEQYPARWVLGHFHTNRMASGSCLRGAPDTQQGATTANAVAQLLLPATEGAFTNLDEVPQRWRWLWGELANACGLAEEDLLADFGHVRIELGRGLPSSVDVPGRDGVAYRRDLDDLLVTLLRVATDPRRLVRLTTEQLLARLSPSWARRLQMRAVHEFPRPLVYQPVRVTVERPEEALDQFKTGYVALVGSPGSGKSTLLTQQLRGRDGVVARYYAYVPGRADIGSTRLEASAFLHDLVLILERQGLPRGPRPVDFDVAALSERLQRQLLQLGDRYYRHGQRAIILVDGLDHVERERGPEESLLRYLPRPEDLPEGVLIVVGSQTVRMVRDEIRAQLEAPGRTLEMGGLGRAAVAEVVRAWEVTVDVERLWHITEGHPLVLTYLLRELRDLPVDEQDIRLASMPQYGGDLGALYRRLWAAVENDDELVELLALACHLRGPVDFAWLLKRGVAPSVVRRLRGRLGHLFRRELGRWHFFHDSFRLFLQDRTAHVGGRPDPGEGRRLHHRLADMCRATRTEAAQSWELLFHLSAAGEHDAVLEIATPGFFRAQQLALRPPELVAADIRMAARSLAEVPDPKALVRLVLAAGELSQRGYHLPDREKSLSLLVRTGQWRIAVEHLEVERESHGIEDDRTVRLRISLLLHDHGHHEDALTIFEANEPLELLNGTAQARGLRGPHQLLYAWARAAVVLRDPVTVVDSVNNVRLLGDAQLSDSEDDRTPTLRAWMLVAAADELDARGRTSESDLVLGRLDSGRRSDREAWIRALSFRWQRQDDRAAEFADVVADRLASRDLGVEERVVVAEGLWKAGRRDSAREWIEDVPQPPLSQPGDVGDRRQTQQLRYRLNRLFAALGQRPDPADVVPAAAPGGPWGPVHAARFTVAVAQLDGRAWAGEQLSATVLMAAVRPGLRVFDSADGGRWELRYEMGTVPADMLARLLRVAGRQRREAFQTIWEEQQRRWRDNGERLLREGPVVLLAALQTGLVARAAVLKWLLEIERLVQGNVSGQPGSDDLVNLAETMLDAEFPEQARRLLGQAFSVTLAVYPRKDYQISSWIDLLGPRLDGDHGGELVRWLAGALVQLREQVDGAQARDAAGRLLVADSARRPGHGWRIGAWLSEHGVLDWDDRLASMLQAHIDHAGDRPWWTALVEQLVPIAPTAQAGLLAGAARQAATTRGRNWLRQRLQDLLQNVDVTAPPQTRPGWRAAAAECAVDCGLELAELDLPEDLHPHRRLPLSRTRGTGEDQRDAFLAAHDTVESLLAGATAAAVAESDLKQPWNEAVNRMADRMDLSQVEQAADLFSVGSHRLRIRLRLAQRALDLGAPDLADRLAEDVQAQAEPRNWLRHWDGGSLLGAFRLLAELDPERTRQRAYRRFAADATADPYLLPEVSQDLDRYRELFGIDDVEALGEEVERYLRVLFGDQGEQPTDLALADDDALAVLARAGVDLLASPYRLAVTSAQRALVTALRAGDRDVQAQLARVLKGQDEELVVRTLSVIESAIQTGSQLISELPDALTRWTTTEHLGIRLGSRRLLKSLGHRLDPVPARPLPALYRIVAPAQDIPAGLGRVEPLGHDDLDAITSVAEAELTSLAESCGVSPGILNARVSSIARQLAGPEPVSDSSWQTADSPLGWTFHRPSIALWERAVSRVAAELADGGRSTGERALPLSTGPGYDPALIAGPPVPRPDAVTPVPEPTDIWIKPEDWLQGAQSGGERLARTCGEWIVIGEHTDLRLLDDKLPRELRTQGLGVLDRLRPRDRSDSYHRMCISDLQTMRARAGATPLIYHWDPSYRGPSTWLTLHPRLADTCGWERDHDTLIGWHDDQGPIVRSLWWRSGWLDAPRWSGHHQVGEGWLVLAQPRALNTLTKMLGGILGIAWRVERDFIAPNQPSNQQSGIRALPSSEPHT